MTGGYPVLAQAALAVFTSYLLQGLRYASLYEAQVPYRVDSLAHQLRLVDVEAGSPWVGKAPADVEGLRVLGVMRGDAWLGARDAAPLRAGDRLLVGEAT